MHIGNRIAEIRSAKKWSQAKLGEAVNQAQTTISSWERGRTEPSREDVERIASAFGVPVAQLELPAAGSRMVSVVGFVGAGDAAHYYEGSQGPFDEVPAPDNATDSTVAAEIQGNSIGQFFNGWLVFWDEVRTPVTSDQIGELCVVGLPDGRILVKKVQPSRTEGLYHLLSQTEGPMLDQEVAWAAKVTNMRPR